MTRQLKDLPVAVIDCETTGLDHTTCSIVNVAVVHTVMGSDHAEVVFQSLVKPPVPIPPDSTRIHGIDDAAVANAPAWRDVADQVVAACAGRLSVGFNAPFDYRVIRAEIERAGLPLTIGWPWLDLLIVRKASVARGRPGRLAELAQARGIVLDAHGAAGDALTTAYLLTPLMREAYVAGAFESAAGARGRFERRYDDDPEDRPRMETVDAFLAWQRSAALWQEQEFAAYRRREGDAQPPRSPWHEVEGVAPPSWDPPVRSTPCTGCGAPIVWAIGRDATRRAVDPITKAPHVCPTKGGVDLDDVPSDIALDRASGAR